MEIENKITELISYLNYHTKLYDEGHPEISDSEWDNKYFELVRLENEYKIYYKDSPTQRVSYQVINKLNKVTHSHPMLSLDKTKSIDDVKAFLGKKEYIVMAKMDGLTCSLTYEKGRLVAAETRGNGIVGEDILHNALQIKSIPKKIDFKSRLVVDGEVICTYNDFEQFKNEYKNPRNFASGSIRLLDSQESASRNLTFIAWDCIEGLENENCLTTKLLDLHRLGLLTVPYIVNEDINISIKMIKEESEKLSYPIDGVVFKYDNIEEYQAAGKTDHHYKGGIAFKFYDESYESTLQDITYDIGRTGQLTPVAVFDTIDIDGTEVSRASLHNISVLEDTLHGPGWIGQKVQIAKMNMIIPQIIAAEEDDIESIKRYMSIPRVCPICGEPTEIKKDNDSEILYCSNPLCSGKTINRLDHFCGKKGLDIKGLSKKTLEKLMDWGWINNYQDIFELKSHRNEWIQKQGFGELSVDNILNAIENSKNITLDKIIAAAGIPEIGSRVAKDLAQHYDSWTAFRAETDFFQYEGIGEIMENNLLTFDYDDLKLDYTVNNYLQIQNNNNQPSSQNTSLEGKVFVITGKLNNFKNRTELVNDIESKGGKVVSSISKKVDYLISNDKSSTSSKSVAAKKAGIQIITEEEYNSLY